jgi:hypothetical protein
MGSLSIWHWFVVVIYLFVILFPVAKIVGKAGYSGWWCLVAVIPLVNLIFLWIFALVTWPNERA